MLLWLVIAIHPPSAVTRYPPPGTATRPVRRNKRGPREKWGIGIPETPLVARGRQAPRRVMLPQERPGTPLVARGGNARSCRASRGQKSAARRARGQCSAGGGWPNWRGRRSSRAGAMPSAAPPRPLSAQAAPRSCSCGSPVLATGPSRARPSALLLGKCRREPATRPARGHRHLIPATGEPQRDVILSAAKDLPPESSARGRRSFAALRMTRRRCAHLSGSSQSQRSALGRATATSGPCACQRHTGSSKRRLPCYDAAPSACC